MANSSKGARNPDFMENELLFKMVIIGKVGVGKTSLVNKFVHGDYLFRMYTTAKRPPYESRTVKMNKTIVKFRIWDTAGAERYGKLSPFFYRGAHGVIIVFDLTDMKSFEQVRDWLNAIDELCDSHVVKVLIGNKADLIDERVVSYELAKEFADQEEMRYIETSAKISTNVMQAFFMMAAEVKKKIDLGILERDTTNRNVVIPGTGAETTGGWCGC